MARVVFKKRQGLVRNATKKKVGDLEFDSELERYAYFKMKDIGIEFEYKPEPITLIEEFQFNGTWIESRKHTSKGKVFYSFEETGRKSLPKKYEPDFKGKGWFIETKGYQEADNWEVKRKLIRKHLKDADITFYVPRTKADVDIVILLITNKINVEQLNTKNHGKSGKK